MTSSSINKVRAHAVGMEWIENGNSVCIRPMHFDSDGIRQVRPYPDPVEFVSLQEALMRLDCAEAEAGILG